MESPIIRFRIDRAIAKEAYRMAAELGMELPDVMRMMLTKAVRLRSFSIDQDQDAPSRPAAIPPVEDYEARYWDPLNASLDAELALALLHRTIADLTTSLDEGLALAAPDVRRLEGIRGERDAACKLLADFDPMSATEVAQILARYGPPAHPTVSGAAA
jgi:antitoxin component of RelBE/YafQ-DinJ toxin-antitoxin module